MPSLLPSIVRFAASAFTLAVLFSLPGSAGAQGPLGVAPSPAASRVLLPGNIHPLAASHAESGPVAAATPTGRVRILLKRSPAQEAELEALLQAMRDPRSPDYRKWLTPAEYGARFGASDTQVKAVSDWLRSEGLTVTRIPAGRTYLETTGRMESVERAFHANLRSYAADGGTFLANAAEPSIPRALAPMIAGVAPLNSFHAQALVHPAGAGRLRGKPSPFLSDPQDGTVFVTPAEAATVYDAPNALNRNFAGGTERRGSGVSVGIAGYSDLATTDYLNYRRQLLNEAFPAQPNSVVDGIDPGTLDQHDGQVTLVAAEIASALAPGANLYVYSSQSDLLEDGLTNAVIRAVEDNQVDILEVSYSVCEANLGASGNAEFNELWKQAAAQGITVVVAAGDEGSAACDAGATTASGGLAVNGLASSQYVLAVGGTDFATISAQFRQYIENPAAPPYGATFAGYIPTESVWNDAIGNNPPGGSASDSTPQYGSNIVAGGGGASSVAFCPVVTTADGSCPGGLTGYPQPGFQAGVVSGHATRTLPDVALFAGTHRQYAATWAICSDTAVAQAAQPISECVPSGDGSFSVEGAGGTGTAAPAFAGVLAVLLESQRSTQPGTRLGLAANGLYNLAQTQPAAFHDITAGNNSVPCTPNSPDCAGNGFLSGQNAGPGYDLASGLGSVDLRALVAAWPSVTYTPTALTLTLNHATGPATLTHGDSVEFEAAVDPGSAAGSVSLTNGPGSAGLAVYERIDLANGAGTVNTNTLPGGSYSIQGYYAGDATHAAATSESIQVTVNRESSILNLSTELQDPSTGAVTPNVTSFPYGTFGFVYAQPESSRNQPDGPATGAVNLFNNGGKLDAPGSPSTQTLNSIGRAAYPVNLYPPGVYQLTASYSGDASYGPSSTAPLTLTIAQTQTKLTAQSSAASIDISGSVTITAVLTTQSTGQYPSGPILLTANGKTFPGTIQQSLAPGNLDMETATFPISASALAPGTNVLTAAYAGDTNYNGANATLTVTVTGAPVPPASFSITGPFNGITLPASATTTTASVIVQSVNAFTGTISLSCAWKPGQAVGGAKCAVQPSALLSANGSVSATITITAPPPPFDPNAPPNKAQRIDLHLRDGVPGGMALCSLLLLMKPVRKRLGRTPLMILAAAGLLSAIGCGVQVTEGTTRQDGIFTAVITGTSGNTTASTEVLVHIE